MKPVSPRINLLSNSWDKVERSDAYIDGLSGTNIEDHHLESNRESSKVSCRFPGEIGQHTGYRQDGRTIKVKERH